jgi:hypothetical protein
MPDLKVGAKITVESKEANYLTRGTPREAGCQLKMRKCSPICLLASAPYPHPEPKSAFV